MKRFRARATVVLLATLAALVAALTAPLSASAVGIHLQEANGTHHYRVGAPDLSLFAPVVETVDGRTLTLVDQGSHQVKIRFNANTTLCVAGANNGADVVIHPGNANPTVST